MDSIKLLEDQIKQVDENVLSNVDPVLLGRLVKLAGVSNCYGSNCNLRK